MGETQQTARDALSHARSPNNADAHFNRWVQRKDRYEKGLELLNTLDVGHADDNFSGLGGSTSGNWKDVAIALAAIDRSLGVDMDEVDPESIMAEVGGKQLGPVKSMWRVWRKWTIDNHTFNAVKLSEKEAQTLTEGTRSTLDEPDEDGTTVVPTIKYTFPAVPKKVRCQPLLGLTT